MKFSRLRLTGFKSFVETTELHFEPGLTGVVGPNGCGKSNLVEAVRWVMGESSYKSMRASGMEDVIFAGTGNRPARNTAEVSVVIDNSDRTAPAMLNNADTLEVTRRIEREVGSIYRVNGREVRARDVQLLFADASTGAHSPSLVPQGRIGELIAAKPVERRLLLEEAAGISGLHSRRHEAELRLKAAEQNLERVDDVIAQIEEQLANLKRQARQAVRFRNLSGDIRRAEATLYHLRWVAARHAEKEAEAAQVGVVKRLADATHADQTAREALDASQQTLQPLRHAEAEAGAALQRLKIEREQVEREVAQAEARRVELESRVAQVASDAERDRALMEEAAEAIERLHKEAQEIDAAAAGQAAEIAAARDQAKQAQDALGEAETGAREASEALTRLQARRASVERSLEAARERMGRLESELAKIGAEAGAMDPPDAADTLGALREALSQARAGADQAEAAAAQAEAAAAQAEAELAAARPALAETDAAITRLESESRTISNLFSSPDKSGAPGLAESLTVPPGYEAALGAVFGEELEAPDDKAAPMHWRHPGAGSADPPLPEGAEPLAGVVKGPELLERRLRQVGVVDPADAERLAGSLSAGQELVTAEGDRWRWDGLVVRADATSAATRRLAQRNRLAEIETELEELGGTAEVHRGRVEALANALEARRQDETEARNAWRDAARSIADAQGGLESAQRDASERDSRRAALVEAKARLGSDLDETQTLAGDAERSLAELGDGREMQAVVEATEGRLQELRRSADEARLRLAGVDSAAAARRARLEQIGTDRESWARRQSDAEAHLKALDERRVEAEAQIDALASAPADLTERGARLDEHIAEASRLQAKAGDRLAAAETGHRERQRAAREATETLSAGREEAARFEERLASLKTQRTQIERQITEALQISADKTAEVAGLKPEAPLPEEAQIEAKLERLRRERERLGGVNLRAEQEAEEVQDRLTTMIADREDLIAAIAKLRGGIQQLNKEGRTRLTRAFDQVNAHFGELFTRLFGGGSAELSFVESDDPLEAGLEIIARPPGKRPQTMTLLSGGEQVLTAISLIFAVFLTNPAPICVLDEVDAPLDDANVERFCDLLDTMGGNTETRFVVITHNPITMSRMDRLFGVTMAEKGVSQLVSVDLATAEGYREAG